MSSDVKKPADSEGGAVHSELTEAQLESAAGGFSVPYEYQGSDRVVAKVPAKGFFRPSPTGDGTTEH